MREIMVRYTLTDEEEKRLEKIAEEYKKKGLDGYYDASDPPVRLSGSQCSGGIEPL